jgi:hypothetical protein
MPEHHQHATTQEHIEGLTAAIEEFKRVSARHFVAGEIERFRFDGKAGEVRFLDDHGSNCLSYAVYNPNNFRVFVGLAGLGATADALIVPKQKLVVAPLQVNGHIELAADEAELKEGSGTILRVRFPVPQPFFVGALV